MLCFSFRWCVVMQMLVESLIIPPGCPVECGLLQRLHRFEGLHLFNQLGSVCAVEGFRQRVIMTVTTTASACEHTRLS
jgi:hypothetical protein